MRKGKNQGDTAFEENLSKQMPGVKKEKKKKKKKRVEREKKKQKKKKSCCVTRNHAVRQNVSL